MSAALTDLALGAGDLMPVVVEVILPYLVPITGGSIRAFWQIETTEHPIRSFPKAALDLIWAILSDDPSEWPYRIEEVIRILSEAPETSGDPRLSELRRRREL